MLRGGVRAAVRGRRVGGREDRGLERAGVAVLARGHRHRADVAGIHGATESGTRHSPRRAGHAADAPGPEARDYSVQPDHRDEAEVSDGGVEVWECVRRAPVVCRTCTLQLHLPALNLQN